MQQGKHVEVKKWKTSKLIVNEAEFYHKKHQEKNVQLVQIRLLNYVLTFSD